MAKDLLDLDGDLPVIEVKLGGKKHLIGPADFAMKYDELVGSGEASLSQSVAAARKASGLGDELSADGAVLLIERCRLYMNGLREGKKKLNTPPDSVGSTAAASKKRKV